MALLRQSLLDDDKLQMVAKQINTLLDEVTAEVQQTEQLNVQERLEVVYDEVKRLVDEMSASATGGNGH